MKIKKILNVLNLSIQKILILGMVFALTGGAIAYAQFYRTTSPTSGFSYGYGYDLSSYGYGYGYHSKIDSTGVYGFLGTDGSATIDSTSSAQTTIAVTYTTTYTATNTVEYGPSYGSSSTPTAEAAGSYTVSLTGLTCGTTYNIRVSSEDAGSNTWNDNATTASTSACSSGGGGGGFVGLGGLNNSNNNTGNNANEVGNGEGCTAAGAFSTTTGLRCPASVGGTSFNHNIEFGATDSDVRALQQYLNAHGFPVASSGAGSPGNETNYFGPATRAALAAFQAANDINPPAGYFGPITRAFVNGN